MAYDVFISYARGDAERVEIIRDKLEGLGLSVFFDAEGIDSGEEFPVVIDRAVKSAKCVLGLWSQTAFTGRWVRIESRIGLDQGKLVAAVIDGTRPEDLPAEFYNVNVVDLSDYRGQARHEGWAQVLRAIGRRVGRRDLAGAPLPRGPQRAAPQAPAAPSQRGAPSGVFWMIAGAAVAAIVIFLVLRPFGAEQTSVSTDPSKPVQEDTASSEDGADDFAARREKRRQKREEEAQRREEEAQRREAENQNRLEAMRRWGACEGGQLAACRAYLHQFPDGEYVRQANAKIEELSRPPPPAAADLSGNWAGYYTGGGNQRTPFEVRIAGAPGRFRGRMSERNTFADRNFPQLFANIAGETNANGVISFVKTYDGTAGVSHSVRYAGRIDNAGQTITGRWSIGSTSGEFQMRRQ